MKTLNEKIANENIVNEFLKQFNIKNNVNN